MTDNNSHKKVAAQRTREWYRANRAHALDRTRRRYLEKKDAVKQYKRAYEAKNRERLREESREYYRANRERLIQKQRAYTAANKDAIRAYSRSYYEKNRLQRKTKSAAYRRANPDKESAIRQRKRARKLNAAGVFTATHWRDLVARSSCCYWCKRPWTARRKPTHDHVIALATGGNNTPENSVCACFQCNSRKRTSRFNPNTGQGILL